MMRDGAVPPRPRHRADRRVSRATGRTLRPGRRTRSRSRPASRSSPRPSWPSPSPTTPGPRQSGPRDGSATLGGPCGDARSGTSGGGAASVSVGACRSHDRPHRAPSALRARSRARRGRRWVVLGVLLVGSGCGGGAGRHPDRARRRRGCLRGARTWSPPHRCCPPVGRPSSPPDRWPAGPWRKRSHPLPRRCPPSSCIEVARRGMNVFESKDAEPVIPASNLKIVTAAAALELLDPEATLTTSFVATSPPQGGVINGDLVVVGGGDPLLTSDPYAAATDNHGPVPGHRPRGDRRPVGGRGRHPRHRIGRRGRQPLRRPTLRPDAGSRTTSPTARCARCRHCWSTTAPPWTPWRRGTDSAAADPALARQRRVSTMLDVRGRDRRRRTRGPERLRRPAPSS